MYILGYYFLFQSAPQTHEEKMRELFEEIDTNGGKLISRSELKVAMQNMNPGVKVTDRDVEKEMSKVDKDMDGRINYEEFIAAYDFKV